MNTPSSDVATVFSASGSHVVSALSSAHGQYAAGGVRDRRKLVDFAAFFLFLSDVVALGLAAILVLAPRSMIRGAHDTFVTAPASHGNFLLLSVFLSVAVLNYLYRAGYYTERLPHWRQVRLLSLVSICAAFTAMVGADLAGQFHTLLPAIVLWVVFFPIGLVFRRLAKRFLDSRGMWRIPVLTIGRPESCEAAGKTLFSYGMPDFESVGSVTAGVILREDVFALRRVIKEQYGARQIMIAADEDAVARQRLIELAVRARVPFLLTPQHGALPIDNRVMAYMGRGEMFMGFRSGLDSALDRAVKILFDITVAGVLMLMVLPVFVIIAIMVKLDGGPIFYGQPRIGRHGELFRCLKFRSMVMNSDEALSELLKNDPAAAAEWAAMRKLTNDPRITRIGKFIRKTSLDELPQLLNVLRLEMSLVGPRPIVSAERPYYLDDIAYYDAVRPGITGLWQVSGRSSTSYQYRVSLDIWYVRNWSLWRDIVILLKTIPAVLMQRGAH